MNTNNTMTSLEWLQQLEITELKNLLEQKNHENVELKSDVEFLKQSLDERNTFIKSLISKLKTMEENFYTQTLKLSEVKNEKWENQNDWINSDITGCIPFQQWDDNPGSPYPGRIYGDEDDVLL